MKALHAVIAVLVCVVLPAASWFDGTGSLAWTMYSGSRSYRLEIAALGPDGARSAIAPSELARFAGREVKPFLVGADSFRMRAYRGLRLRLSEVGDLACRHKRVDAIEIALETKRTLDAAPEVTRARVRCADVAP